MESHKRSIKMSSVSFHRPQRTASIDTHTPSRPRIMNYGFLQEFNAKSIQSGDICTHFRCMVNLGKQDRSGVLCLQTDDYSINQIVLSLGVDSYLIRRHKLLEGWVNNFSVTY